MDEEDSPVLGLHIEGPYLNSAQARVLDPELSKAPEPEKYEPLLDKNPCIKRLIFAEHSRESPLKVE